MIIIINVLVVIGTLAYLVHFFISGMSLSVNGGGSDNTILFGLTMNDLKSIFAIGLLIVAILSVILSHRGESKHQLIFALLPLIYFCIGWGVPYFLDKVRIRSQAMQIMKDKAQEDSENLESKKSQKPKIVSFQNSDPKWLLGRWKINSDNTNEQIIGEEFELLNQDEKKIFNMYNDGKLIKSYSWNVSGISSPVICFSITLEDLIGDYNICLQDDASIGVSKSQPPSMGEPVVSYYKKVSQ